jgi:hypothetical protein
MAGSESNAWVHEMVRIAEQGTAIAYETWPAYNETDAILQDPVWRDRLTTGLEQAKRGESRPIEEYWAESDEDDDGR